MRQYLNAQAIAWDKLSEILFIVNLSAMVLEYFLAESLPELFSSRAFPCWMGGFLCVFSVSGIMPFSFWIISFLSTSSSSSSAPSTLNTPFCCTSSAVCAVSGSSFARLAAFAWSFLFAFSLSLQGSQLLRFINVVACKCSTTTVLSPEEMSESYFSASLKWSK